MKKRTGTLLFYISANLSEYMISNLPRPNNSRQKNPCHNPDNNIGYDFSPYHIDVLTS
jgi:hypothetical protein